MCIIEDRGRHGQPKAIGSRRQRQEIDCEWAGAATMTMQSRHSRGRSRIGCEGYRAAWNDTSGSALQCD